MFHISSHISVHPSPEAHPHTGTPKADQGDVLHAPAPVSVTPGMDFFSHGASGQPSGLLRELFAPVKLPDEPHTFYMKERAKGGPQQLYTRDPQTGAYRQSAKQVMPDGTGGGQRDSGLKGGVEYSPEERAKRLEEARTKCHQAAVELAVIQDRVTEARSEYNSAQDGNSKQAAHDRLIAEINAHSKAATHFRNTQADLLNAQY